MSVAKYELLLFGGTLGPEGVRGDIAFAPSVISSPDSEPGPGDVTRGRGGGIGRAVMLSACYRYISVNKPYKLRAREGEWAALHEVSNRCRYLRHTTKTTPNILDTRTVMTYSEKPSQARYVFETVSENGKYRQSRV